MARLNCQMPFCHKDKKQAHFQSQTYIHFLTLRICVHTSVRSHHITHGEEILLFVCGLFLCFPSPGLSPRVASPTRSHAKYTRQHV